MSVKVVVFISLLIDLLAFTLILPLLPSTLECFSKNDLSGLYSYIHDLIITSQRLINIPPKFNKALYGGLIGSWFSLLQFVSMPIIGSLSDVYGRRSIYLLCLLGISISYLFWNFSANYFTIFILFRTLCGISKGNISLSTAIVTDISAEDKRGKGFALIGIAFSIGFILGPLIGAFLSMSNSSLFIQSTCFNFLPPLTALIFSLINLFFSYRFLPETLSIHKRSLSICNGLVDSLNYINPWSLFSFKIVKNLNIKEKQRLRFCAFINFSFLFLYSGLEFTLPFLTYIRFDFTNIEQGKLFFYVGMLMLMVQAFLVRKINTSYYGYLLFSGILAVIPAFIIIGLSPTQTSLYLGLIPYAYSSATVVPTLSAIFSTFGPSNQKGVLLGIFRSIGALARALGPITASFLFWRYGIAFSYLFGSVMLFFPLYLTYKLLNLPKLSIYSP